MQSLITGLQHIGLPVLNLEESLHFYEGLSFKCIHKKTIQREEGIINVGFIELHNLIIELYEFEGNYLDTIRQRKDGHIDHIALNVTDIDAVYKKILEGNYTVLDKDIQFIPFFDQGVRFFTILGPNNEKIEFNQKL